MTSVSQAFCINFAGIASVQFLFGLVESIIGPVYVVITSNSWKYREQPFVMAFWLCGTPACLHFLDQAFGYSHWLTKKERLIAVERVRENQSVGVTQGWSWSQFWEAIRDPQTTFFFVSAVQVSPLGLPGPLANL